MNLKKKLIFYNFNCRGHSRISPQDLFKHKGHAESCILEGKPGSGKTTLLKHFTISWALNKLRGFVDSPDDGPTENLPLFDKDLVVYIDTRHEGQDLDETIKNALKGPAKEKKDALKLLREHPDKCHLFIDALDEFQNEKVIRDIYTLASDGSLDVLVTCREGHPYLKDKMENFTHHVKVDGFGPDDVQNFVQKCMKTLIPDNEQLCRRKTEILSSHIRRPMVSKLYTSPIHCAFLCLLYVEGKLTTEELTRSTIPTLFAKQQYMLLMRECHKHASKNHQCPSALFEKSKETVRRIHQLALNSSNQDICKPFYTAKQLKQFGIDVNSPAMVLLAKEPGASVDGEEDRFSWPHAMIREFHAAQAVNQDEIIYYIVSKPQLDVVTKFLISMMAETNLEKAKETLITMFLLQSDTPPCGSSRMKRYIGHCCADIYRLKNAVCKLEFGEMIKYANSKSRGPSRSLNVQRIQTCLRKNKWISLNASTLGKVTRFIEECTSDDIRPELHRAVIHPLLPLEVGGDAANEMFNDFVDLEVKTKDTKAYWYPVSDNFTQVTKAFTFSSIVTQCNNHGEIDIAGIFLYLKVDCTLKLDDFTRHSLKKLVHRVRGIDHLILDVENTENAAWMTEKVEAIENQDLLRDEDLADLQQDGAQNMDDVAWTKENIETIRNLVKPKTRIILSQNFQDLLRDEDLHDLQQDGVLFAKLDFFK